VGPNALQNGGGVFGGGSAVAVVAAEFVQAVPIAVGAEKITGEIKGFSQNI
jgi:hypothetical protein